MLNLPVFFIAASNSRFLTAGASVGLTAGASVGLAAGAGAGAAGAHAAMVVAAAAPPTRPDILRKLRRVIFFDSDMRYSSLEWDLVDWLV